MESEIPVQILYKADGFHVALMSSEKAWIHFLSPTS